LQEYYSRIKARAPFASPTLYDEIRQRRTVLFAYTSYLAGAGALISTLIFLSPLAKRPACQITAARIATIIINAIAHTKDAGPEPLPSSAIFESPFFDFPYFERSIAN
jgi:hypothetical protein